MVLGTGGTALTSHAVVVDQGASKVIQVSRTGEINYQNIYSQTDVEIIINTTPVGMFPKNGESAVDLSLFPNICGVIDVVYNPMKTALILQAESLNIPSAGGLKMLVSQAAFASERFMEKKISLQKIEQVFEKISSQVTNVVLVGMPGSGKTSIGKLIAEKLGKIFVDIDEEIVNTAQKTIPEIFTEQGESAFRALETKVIEHFGKENSQVISTGGGAILKQENIDALRQNGVIIWVKRDLELLETTGRPLSADNDAVIKLYRQREPIYNKFSDFFVENNGTIEETLNRILEVLNENSSS